MPWLSDHRLLSDAVLPAAGYIAMAIEVVPRVHDDPLGTLPFAGYSLQNVAFQSALPFPEDDRGIELLISMEVAESSSAQRKQ